MCNPAEWYFGETSYWEWHNIQFLLPDGRLDGIPPQSIPNQRPNPARESPLAAAPSQRGEAKRGSPALPSSPRRPPSASISRPPFVAAHARQLFDGMRAPARRQAPGGERPDRGISALPDEVLHLVLSLLPAHEAVRTCVLARRWRHLWTDAPGLRVTNGEEWDNPWGSGVDRFVRFVDSLLSLRRRGAPPLEYCDFDFDLEGLLLDKERHVIRWIRRALRCQARVLRISFRNDAELPDMRLLSQHLTRLEICGGIDSDDSFFDLSYCPSLVDLKIESAILIAGRMSSPSLKKLSIIHCDFCSGKRTRMSFPNLASLELGCYYGRAPILERMSSLVEASVRFGCRCEDHCYKSVLGDCGDDSCQGCNDFCELPVDSTSCVCLKGLSEATHLKLLAADPTMYIFRRDLKLHFAYHTFAKLKTLFLNEWCVTPDPSALIWFLQRSPILEKLTLQIQQAPMDSMDSEEHYNSAEQPFASNHLRIVEIECEEVNMWVCEILKTLSTYGIPLKQISVKKTSGRRGSGCFNFVCTGFSYN